MTLEKIGRSEDDLENSTFTRSGGIHNGISEEDYESSRIMPNLVPDIRLFNRRWLQLALYVVCSTTSNMQWFQYTVCSNIMEKYWDVSSFSIQWTSMIYEVVYLLGVFPAIYLMGRLSLRWTILIGAGGTCVGAWIKVFSVSPDLFAVTISFSPLVSITAVTTSGGIHVGKIEEEQESTNISANSVPEIRLFNRRWVQLALFVSCSMTTNMQWFQYTVCSNIMEKYWDVSSLSIQWTSIIYQVVYLIGIFPATFMMRRISLRWTILIGASATCIGAWIKVFSVSPDLFAVTFVGQTVVAIAQIFITTLPGRLAACWFGPKEVATATTIACYGIEVGALIGFVVTTRSVRNHADIADIGDDLYQFFFTVAIVCTVVLVLILLLFQDQPSLPPSITRALQRTNQDTENTERFWPQVRRILTNRSFVVLWNTYGSVVCILTTMNTVSNPLYLARFKVSPGIAENLLQDAEVEIGNLGLLTALAGTISATFFARVLDKTKKFRLVTTSLCISSLLFQILFAISMVMKVKWLVFVNGGVWGASLVGYAVLSLDLAVETTYPEAEQVVLAIYSIAPQIYGTILIMITGRMIDTYGDVAGHACMIVTLAFGTILATVIKLDLRRSDAARVAGYSDVKLQVLKPKETESIKS